MSLPALLTFEGVKGPVLWLRYALTGPASGTVAALISQGSGRSILATRLWPVSNPTDAEFAYITVQDQTGNPLPSQAFQTTIPCQTGAAEPSPVGLPINTLINNQLNVGGLTNGHTYYLYVLFERSGTGAQCP